MNNNKKIINPNIGWWILNWTIGFFICGYSVASQQWLYLIFLFFPFYFLLSAKIKSYWKIIGFLCWCLFTIFFVIQETEITTKIAINFLEQKVPNFFDIRKNVIQIIDNNYAFNRDGGSYLKLLLLNQKDQNGWKIYTKTINLGIAHLFVISGLHLNLISIIIHKLIFFKIKRKRWIFFLDLFISMVIGYFVRFSISIIRIIVSTIIKIANPKLNLLEYSCISCLFILFLFKNEVLNFGFLMSYLCIFTVAIIDQTIDNKLLKSLWINLGCIIVTMPFIFEMNKQINVLLFLYNIVFSPLIILHFIWSIIFSWIPAFFTLNIWLIEQIIKFVDWNLNFIITFPSPNYQLSLNLGAFGFIFFFKKIKNFCQIVVYGVLYKGICV